VTSDPEAARYAPDVARVYINDAVEVTWSPSLCIHWAACVGGNERVFNPQRRPWVDLDADEAERIVEIVDACPTGALNARLLREDVQIETSPNTMILPQADGPLFLRGRIRILAPNGDILREGTRMALCRCGASRNKPFCDDSHYNIGFKA